MRPRLTRRTAPLGDAELEKKFSSDRKVIRADALLSAGLLIDGVTNCGGEEPCLEKGIKAYGKVSDPSAGLVIKWAKAKSAFAVKRNSSAGVETAINELKQLGISDSVKASKARAAIIDIALEHCSTTMTSTVSRCEAPFLSEAREVAYGDPNLRGQYAGLSLKYADALSRDANRNTTDTLQKSEDLCQAANAYLDSVRIDGLEDFEKAHAYEWRADALAFLHDNPSSTCKPDGVSAGLQQAALDSYLSARANRSNSARGMKFTSVTTFAKLLNTAGLSNPGNLTVAKLFGEVGNVTATTTSTAQRELDMLELLTSIKRSPNVSDLRQAKNRFGEFPHPHLELGKFLIRTSNSSTTSEVKSLFAEANRLASPGNKYPEVAAEANYLLSVIEMRAIDSTNPVQTGEAVRTAERAVEFDPSKVSYLNQACKAHLQYQRKEFGGDRACNRIQSVGEGAILRAMTKYREAQIVRKGRSQTNSLFREAEEAFEQITASGSFVGTDGIAYDSRRVVELGRVLFFELRYRSRRNGRGTNCQRLESQEGFRAAWLG